MLSYSDLVSQLLSYQDTQIQLLISQLASQFTFLYLINHNHHTSSRSSYSQSSYTNDRPTDIADRHHRHYPTHSFPVYSPTPPAHLGTSSERLGDVSED